jgi:hypothetical protein
MLPDTGIDDVKKQRNAEYAKLINDPVLSSLKMKSIRFFPVAKINIRITRIFSQHIRYSSEIPAGQASVSYIYILLVRTTARSAQSGFSLSLFSRTVSVVLI